MPPTRVRNVQQAYAFLARLTPEEEQLAVDPYGREDQIYRQLARSVASWTPT